MNTIKEQARRRFSLDDKLIERISLSLKENIAHKIQKNNSCLIKEKILKEDIEIIKQKKPDYQKRREKEYHNWFLIHSGMKSLINGTKKEVLSKDHSQLIEASNEIKNFENMISKEKINQYISELEMTRIGIDDYAIWFEKNCVKRANIKLDSEDSLNKAKKKDLKLIRLFAKNIIL